MIDIWFKNDLHITYEDHHVLVFIDESGDAEFLLKTGMETGNPDWIDFGNHALNYTLSNQMADGTFDYNGPPEQPANFIDNYHTGFVLRMLHSLWKLTGRDDVFTALDKCHTHYINSFFENQEIPKLLPHRKHRIDIHSCSESIYCLSLLSQTYPNDLELSDKVLNWTLSNLQDPGGYFYYGILKGRISGSTYKSKIPYIRWAQAWMLKALTARYSISVMPGSP